MKKRLSHVAPLQLGLVLAVLYGLLSLIFVPFFLIFSILAPHMQNSAAPGVQGIAMGMGIGMAIVFPIIYAILGFVFGVISAAVYNLIAQWTGGIEFSVTDLAVPA